jgi:hypothetical protein
MEELDLLESILPALETYDAHDLVAGFGALQLVPANADQLLQLEVAAAAAASLPVVYGHTAVSNQRWRAIANVALDTFPALATLSDPLAHPFTEALTFDGGSYVVFPGLDADAPYILRRLVSAIFLMQPRVPDADFNRSAYQAVRGGLIVSNEVARRVGLRRNLGPDSSPSERVTVPFPEPFERLKSAVCFSSEELEALLRSAGLGLNAIDPLVCDAGAPSIVYQTMAPLPMLLTPIVCFDDRLVVASPGALLIALRHRLIQFALEHGQLDELADRYHHAVVSNVETSIETYLDCSALPIVPFDFENPAIENSFFDFDFDKILNVVVITDRVDGYDPATPFGIWDAASLVDLAQQRLQDIEAHVFAVAPPGRANAILHLIVVQGAGRTHFYGIDEPQEPVYAPRLGLSASGLEIVAMRMAGEPLALWQFVKASDAANTTVGVMSTDTLDEFAYYLSHDESFYLGDDSPPTMLMVPPGGAGSLLREVLDRFDPHAVVGPVDDALVDVVRRKRDERIPGYAPRRPLGYLALYSEALHVNVWIVGPENLQDPRYVGLYNNFGRMLLYWIWQFAPSLNPLLQVDVGASDPIVVHLEVIPDEAWFDADQEASPTGTPIECHVDGPSLRLRISAAGLPDLVGPDNTGEREVLRIFLRAFLDLAGRWTLPVSEDEIGAMLDLHAPVGLKKMVLFTPSSSNLPLDNRGLGHARTVQASETHRVLDEIGRFLIQERGLRVGPIPDVQRVGILNAVFARLFAELERIVTTLSPTGLLEYLVTSNETLLTRQASMRLTTPTYMACFASEAEVVTELAAEIPNLATTLSASRFLIEYVSARPPCGVRQISNALYDRLVALASEMINRAFASDVIHHGLADIPLDVTPSERLGMERGAHEAAMRSFSSEHTFGEISRSHEDFESYWQGEAHPEARDRLAEIDDPSLEEFGLTVRDLLAFLRTTIDLGERLSGVTKSMPLRDCVAGASKVLAWPPDRVRQALEVFAARPRADFQQPPAPFETRDVFPGNFSRRLSYLRKPLLVRPTRADDEELVWGNRNVYLSGKYLWHLILNGRFEAQSAAMQAAVSRLQSEESDAFNQRVFDLFDTPPNSLAKMKVTAVGGLPIARPNGEDLGDVDVLVADVPSRRLIAIEAKDLAGARTPSEVVNEIDQLFKSKGKNRSTVEKHGDRIDWLRTHLPQVLAWLGVPGADASEWTVEPLIVLDKETPAPLLAGVTMPVVTYYRLRAERAR